MIVVDANILAYSLLEDERTPITQQVRIADPVWAAPSLWVFEFENILAMFLRAERWKPEQASEFLSKAETLLALVRNPPQAAVFGIVHRHKITACDAQYVALAGELSVPLVTQDSELLRKFPVNAYSLEGYLEAFGPRGIHEPGGTYSADDSKVNPKRKKTRVKRGAGHR